MSASISEPRVRNIAEIEDEFLVPAYQRGYRWTDLEVNRLLDDIYQEALKPGFFQDSKKAYFLQPVVVTRRDDKFEVIDGQQRLTTLYLIYQFIWNLNREWFCEPPFSISYETRKDSGEFLMLDEESRQVRKDENIDFCFIANASKAIAEWFGNDKRERNNRANIISQCLNKVKIIWYEVDESDDPIALFERLNIGKIPLTNSELVKALFLSENTNPNQHSRDEIARQWDEMEKDLRKESFWDFLTNPDEDTYQTRIDLVLELMADIDETTAGIDAAALKGKDPYRTFFYFDKRRAEIAGNGDEAIRQLWGDIQQTFLTLQDWYEDKDLYHQIGYLIASGAKGVSLASIFKRLRGLTKTQVREELNTWISETIKDSKNYGDMSYQNDAEKNKIARLLLLFNVESVRKLGGDAQRFPFDQYKGMNLTLEHIHAQQSEGLKTEKEWRTWIELHIPFVRKVLPDESQLIGRMVELTQEGVTVKRDDFDEVQRQVFDHIPGDGGVDLHSIDNLALLSAEGNSALSNAVFSVKRDQIIKMDCEGKYIPYCTKMVFLKYYTKSEQTKDQIYFWGPQDRAAYKAEINKVLKPYLAEEIK